MKDFEPRDFVHLHAPDAVEVTREGTRIQTTVHTPDGLSDAEIIETIEERYGHKVLRLGEEVSDHDRGARAAKSFGFTNWNGSKWKPAGPKSNHGYNPEESDPSAN